MASISGSSSPEPIRGDSKSSREAILKTPSGKELIVTNTTPSPSTIFSVISRLFSPAPSSPSLSERSISPASAGDGTSSPISEIVFKALEIEKKEDVSAKAFSGTHGPFTVSSFGPCAKDDESYNRNIGAIFKSPGDKIKFNLEDFDAVTGSKVASTSALLAPIGLRPLDKLLRQIYLDVSRDMTITIFGEKFNKENFSNPSDQTSCKQELKDFITSQLKKESISESMALRIVNCLHQGVQAPIVGLVNLVFNKTHSSFDLSKTGQKAHPLEPSIIKALEGVPIDTIGDIQWEKVKEHPFNKLDINVIKTGVGVKVETALFIKLNGSEELAKHVYEAKLTIEDLSSGLSFVEIKQIL